MALALAALAVAVRLLPALVEVVVAQAKRLLDSRCR
jgi:hypothetical protein